MSAASAAFSISGMDPEWHKVLKRTTLGAEQGSCSQRFFGPSLNIAEHCPQSSVKGSQYFSFSEKIKHFCREYRENLNIRTFRIILDNLLASGLAFIHTRCFAAILEILYIDFCNYAYAGLPVRTY